MLVEIRVPKLRLRGLVVHEARAVAPRIGRPSRSRPSLHGNGAVDRASIALTNMGATSLRAKAAEAALVGGASPAEAAALAAEGTEPPSDQAASADFRRHLARVLTRRALEEASARLATAKPRPPRGRPRWSLRASGACRCARAPEPARAPNGARRRRSGPRRGSGGAGGRTAPSRARLRS